MNRGLICYNVIQNELTDCIINKDTIILFAIISSILTQAVSLNV